MVFYFNTKLFLNIFLLVKLKLKKKSLKSFLLQSFVSFLQFWSRPLFRSSILCSRLSSSFTSSLTIIFRNRLIRILSFLRHHKRWYFLKIFLIPLFDFNFYNLYFIFLVLDVILFYQSNFFFFLLFTIINEVIQISSVLNKRLLNGYKFRCLW